MNVDLAVLVMLASALTHFEEYHGNTGHPVDLEAAKTCMRNEGVQDLLAALRADALIPLKR